MAAPEPSRYDDSDVSLDITLTPPAGGNDSPDIWMDPAVKEQIAQYARTDTTRELGGVLLGELRETGEHPLVRVLAAIEAKHTEAVSTSVKFTHATWDDIHRVKDERYPDLKIVGWFHTHPGFGIFLSRWDLFIQHNFFNLPWQIAYVVDPIEHTQGFFRWENGKVARAGQPAEPVRPAAVRVGGEQAPVPAGLSAVRTVVAAGAFVAGVALGVACMAFFRPPRERIVERPVVRVIQAPAPASVKPSSAPPKQPAPWSRAYTVQPGDTLWRIAVSQYGSGGPAEGIRVLNHLQDPNRLNVGATLLLPSPDLARALSEARPAGSFVRRARPGGKANAHAIR